MRARDVCLREFRRIGGVTGDRLHALLAQFLDQLAVLLHHDERQAALSERLSDPAAHSSIADQHDVTRGVVRRRRGRQGRQRIRPAFEPAGETAPPLQPALHGLDRLEHDRVQRDRDDGAGQDEILSFYRKQAERNSETGQDEGELADLRQACRHGERRVERIAEGYHQQEGRERLADEDHGDDGEDLERAREHHRGIEQHADRDEEQHRERVAQGQRFLRRAVAQV